jgi:perosamine synthetase
MEDRADADDRAPADGDARQDDRTVRLAGGLDQRRLMQRLLDLGIATRRGVMCAHREGAFPHGSWRCGAPPRGCPPARDVSAPAPTA